MKVSTVFLTVTTTLHKIWHRFWEALEGDAEPHIWKTLDRGNPHWHTYDPATGESRCLDSEAEVRAWLEERYYA